jgi:hypothetical protein
MKKLAKYLDEMPPYVKYEYGAVATLIFVVVLGWCVTSLIPLIKSFLSAQ